MTAALDPDFAEELIAHLEAEADRTKAAAKGRREVARRVPGGTIRRIYG